MSHLPLDLEALLSLPKLDGSQSPTPTHSSAGASVAMVPYVASSADNTPAAAALLGSVWPAKGKGRHIAQMALAGALVRGGWSDDQATAFLCSVCKIAGDEDPYKRRTSVLDARARAVAGEEYTGFRTLETFVSPDIVRAARKLLGMSDDIDGSVLTGTFEASPDADPDDPLNVVTPGKKTPLSFKEIGYYLSQTQAWAGVLRFNVLSRKHVAVCPPFRMRMEQGNLSDGDIGKIRDWFDSQGFKASKDAIKDNIAKICESRGRGYNPFVEYLDALPRATGNLALVHMTIFRSSDPLTSSLFTKTLVAAVRRSRSMPEIGQDPVAVDHQFVLILIGDQDAGKGRLVRLLGGRWYKKLDVRRLNDKDTTIKAQGAVLVELEEASCQGKDRDTLKAFLSAGDDEERSAYERGAEITPRSYAMIATSNDPRLEDPTGHRRWAPVILPPGTTINIEAAEALRDDLWSEANALALDVTYDHHLTPDEKARCAELCGDIEAENNVTEGVLDALAGRPFVTLREVYDHITKGTKKDDILPRRDQHAISDSLRSLGCVKARPVIKGLQMRGWEVPPALAAGIVSEEGAAYRASLELAAGLRAATRN